MTALARPVWRDASQSAIAAGLRTGLYVIAAGALLAIAAALACPHRRNTSATL